MTTDVFFQRTSTTNIGRIFFPPSVMVVVSFLTFLIPPDQARTNQSIIKMIRSGRILHRDLLHEVGALYKNLKSERQHEGKLITTVIKMDAIWWKHSTIFKSGTNAKGNTAVKIERCARVILPSLFAAFCAAFFFYVLKFSRPEELAGEGHVLREVEMINQWRFQKIHQCDVISNSK